MTRRWLSAAFALLTVLAALSTAATAQVPRGLRDMVYVSPTWGYAVRWYAEDWTIDTETSVDGVDELWLTDAAGNVVGFQGSASYDGNAIACLDDLIATLETTETLSVVSDELGAAQELRHPWRSWVLLLVSGDDPADDSVVYLDCRTLVPGAATLIRSLGAPAGTFEESYGRFSVLNAALPRSAWLADGVGGLTAPAQYPSDVIAPVPVDPQTPWDHPGPPQLLLGPDGAEWGTMTEVDGIFDPETRLVRIETSGAGPLRIDPALFRASNHLTGTHPDADVAPARAVWEDTLEPGPRSLPPGTTANVLLEFPDLEPLTTDATFLTYWDDGLRDGAVMLACLDRCGYGGGGYRPLLRLGR